MLAHTSLRAYYEDNISLLGQGFQINEIDNLLPWELEVYKAIFLRRLEEDAERKRQKQ